MADNHEHCLQFPTDFETKKIRGIAIGRLMLGQHVGRLWLTPKGLHLVISQSAIDEGAITILPPDEDQLYFAGVPK